MRQGNGATTVSFFVRPGSGLRRRGFRPVLCRFVFAFTAGGRGCGGIFFGGLFVTLAAVIGEKFQTRARIFRRRIRKSASAICKWIFPGAAGQCDGVPAGAGAFVDDGVT